MRRLLPLVLGLALLGGCGGSSGDDQGGTGGTHTETLPLGAESTATCLGERGFSIRPTTSGVSAVSPSGAEFTLAFFDSEADAGEAASAGDDTPVANAVLTAADEPLTSEELAAVEQCVRGG